MRKKTKARSSPSLLRPRHRGSDGRRRDGGFCWCRGRGTLQCVGIAKETVAGGELEDESVYRAKEREELVEALMRMGRRTRVSGLYDLVCKLFFVYCHVKLLSTIVTHKPGAVVDAGHYRLCEELVPLLQIYFLRFDSPKRDGG